MSFFIHIEISLINIILNSMPFKNKRPHENTDESRVVDGFEESMPSHLLGCIESLLLDGEEQPAQDKEPTAQVKELTTPPNDKADNSCFSFFGGDTDTSDPEEKPNIARLINEHFEREIQPVGDNTKQECRLGDSINFETFSGSATGKQKNALERYSNRYNMPKPTGLKSRNGKYFSR